MRAAAVIGIILFSPAGLSVSLAASTSEGYLNDSVVDTIPSTSSVLRSDVLAAAAAINQQIYQSSINPSQWKKCNKENSVYRREW